MFAFSDAFIASAPSKSKLKSLGKEEKLQN